MIYDEKYNYTNREEDHVSYEKPIECSIHVPILAIIV